MFVESAQTTGAMTDTEWYHHVFSDVFTFADEMNLDLTWQQREVLQAVDDGHLKITVRSGQGVGKTVCSIVPALFRLGKYYESKVIVTAPTMKQAKDVWLGEVRKKIKLASPRLQRFFNVTKTKVVVDKNDNWALELRTSTSPESAQGDHSENMSVIIEEASGVDRALIHQYLGTLSNPNSFLLLIGNPNARSSYFFDTFNRLRDDWHCIHIDAEKTPISSWFGATRNADIAREFGIDSDVYRVRVKGDFPSVDPDSVMGSEELERCTGPDRLMAAIREGRSSGFRRAIGYDFARFGSDESVIAVRNGYALTSLESFAKVDPSRVVAKGFVRQKELAWPDKDVQHIFDAGGMGQGLAHIFYDAGKECLEFNFGGKPMDSAYGNLITEAYFLFAKMIREKTVYIPNDPTLIRQLSNRKYMVNNKGKIVLEEKSVFKRRNQDEEGNGDSPDRADACVMAFYDASQYEVQVG